MGLVAACGAATAVIVLGCATGEMPRVTRPSENAFFTAAADVNGRRIGLVLDTGSAASILFARSAKELGLKMTEPAPGPVPPGKVAFGTTEPVEFTLWGKRVTRTFLVVDLPLHPRVGGLLGWPDLAASVFRIDAGAITFMERVPREAQSWIPLPVDAGGSTLAFHLPARSGSGTDNLQIDTGGIHGVSLTPEEWHEWTAAHPNRSRTLVAHYMPGAGLRVQELAWADEITLGSLTLLGVPVREATVTEIAMGPRYRATLGLAALRQLDLVVDGKNFIAYIRPKTTQPPVPNYNRGGAEFVPSHAARPEDLVAVVLPGTPAWDAGIRDGDVLLKVDEWDATTWMTDPRGTPGRFFRLPAGTSLTLALRRGERGLRVVVVLADLIGPGVPPRPAPRAGD